MKVTDSCPGALLPRCPAGPNALIDQGHRQVRRRGGDGRHGGRSRATQDAPLPGERPEAKVRLKLRTADTCKLTHRMRSVIRNLNFAVFFVPFLVDWAQKRTRRAEARTAVRVGRDFEANRSLSLALKMTAFFESLADRHKKLSVQTSMSLIILQRVGTTYLHAFWLY